MTFGGDAAGERYAHPAFCISLQRTPQRGRIIFRAAAATVYFDHAGDPGSEQPRITQQGTQIRIGAPLQTQTEQPGFQQIIGNALLLLGPEGATTVGTAGQWTFGFLANRCLTIAGGTSEIQRAIRPPRGRLPSSPSTASRARPIRHNAPPSRRRVGFFSFSSPPVSSAARASIAASEARLSSARAGGHRSRRNITAPSSATTSTALCSRSTWSAQALSLPLLHATTARGARFLRSVTASPGLDAAAYLAEAIAEPSAFLSPGRRGDVSMPALAVTDEEIDRLVDSLLGR